MFDIWKFELILLVVVMDTSTSTETATHRRSCCSPPDEEIQSSLPLISLTPIRKPKHHKFHGYDCEFVATPPVLVKTECSICLLIFRQPHLLSCCGHNFCKDCIAHIMADSQPCPLCKSNSFTMLRNQDLERALAQLEVSCVNSKLGCDWTGELGRYDQHLNVSPEDDKAMLVGCKYVELECSYKCGSWFHRGALAKHQSEKCPQRPFCCDYCNEYVSIHADVIYRHWPVCKCYPVSCPNNCTAYAIERQNLEEHLLQCPLKQVECEFHSCGCEEIVVRDEMCDHLEEFHIQHTSMLAASNTRLVEELAEKNDQIFQLKNESSQELSKVRDEAQRQQDNLWVENALLKDQLATMRKEIEDIKNQFTSFSTNYKSTFTEAEKQRQCSLEELSSAVSEVQSDLSQSKTVLSDQTFSIQASIGLFPLEFIMPNVSDHFESMKEWQSIPFHSHLQGYRLCLVVYPGETQDDHLAVHACLLRGEYDDQLKWPFHAEIAVQLKNMVTDRNHATSIIRFNHNTPDKYTSRVDGSRADDDCKRGSEGWGLKRFIRHSELGYNSVKNRQHLKDDKLCFRIIKVSLSD